MVTMSEEIGKLATALVAAQADVETALKASTNPHYGSSYADLTSVLGVIKPALATHGLAMVQYPGYGDGLVSMTTILVHSSGEWLQSPLAAIPISKQDPHGAMSGITYLRRGCASSLLALIADDDDGNAAVGPAPKPAKATKATKATKSKLRAHPNEAERLVERLNTLSGIVTACEEHGGVDTKVLAAAAAVVAAKGPISRVEKAIKHLEGEVGRV